MLTSKSPQKVAIMALQVAKRALPLYSHVCSPRIYTQPQLFAILVLKQFFRTDHRGISQILTDVRELRLYLELERVPHFTTLHKASRRLLRLQTVRKLLASSVGKLLGRRRTVSLAAMDSSGLDCGHASRYYVKRRDGGNATGPPKPARKLTYRRYPKLEMVVDCATHLILAAVASRGPAPDADRFVLLLEDALACVRIRRLVADAGYDSEPNHEHARHRRGVQSLMPAQAGRPSVKPPTGKWRRRMRRCLRTKRWRRRWGYGQRWQVECGFSMIKRRQGDAVAARSYWSQCRELLLMALTHNILVIAAA